MITGKSQLICLLGSPVAHSVSPMMHNEAFRLLHLNYTYLCFEATEKDLEEAISALKLFNARGFNCTMPVKTLAYELCDETSPAADLMGAVNTVVIEKGRLMGHNTDGIGYTSAVREAGYDLTGKHMTLLGGGGAANAIAVQAALDGASQISIFNSPHPPVSVYGTGTVKTIAAFLDAWLTCFPTLVRSASRLWLMYRFFLVHTSSACTRLSIPRPCSPHMSPQFCLTAVQESQPVVHRLRLSASP